MTLPIGRLDLLFGYALAFGSIAVVQVSLAAGVSLWWLGLDLAGPVGMLLVIAVLDALLGMALGLFVSAFARTEFQAIQFMPVFVLPQILLCGLFVPREQMVGWLEGISNALPLTYAVEALAQVGISADATATMWRDLVIVAGATVVALVLAAATLRRRTP
jgi:ABC-2 type transport system permease protein